MADWVGRQLGNYSLTRLLGEGGFAEVYLGEHVHLGTQAAIKVLHTQLGGEDIDKFRVEARTIARLQHPNIVRVLDFGIENKNPFLVMDYAPNGTLRNKHTRGQHVPLSSVVSYVKQVAEALQCAHDEKMVHRDVKPENMLVGRRNEILLSDFGIATATQTSRQNTQDITGTVAYMSPEQIQGKPRSASDQYSLAIVAYEWLSGERPFNGSFTEIAVQHAVVPPPPLREKVPSLSPDVERVIMIALEKDPVKRFSSVQAFANALEQASKDNANASIEVKPQQKALEPTVFVPPVVTPVMPLAPTQYALMSEPAGTVIATYREHSDRIMSVSWSPDSKYLAVGSDDKTATVWEVSTGRKILTYHGHSYWINCIAWSPHNKYIATGSEDKTIQIWEAFTGYQPTIFNNRYEKVRGVTWSPDGRDIASTTFDAVLLYKVDAKKFTTYEGRGTGINAVSWSPDGNWLAGASSNKLVSVWNVAYRHEVIVYKGHTHEVVDLVWFSDNTRIASVSRDKTVHVWDSTTGNSLFVYRNHNDAVNALDRSPDGKYLASGSRDGTVRVWDVITGRDIAVHKHNASVQTVKWSPDGKYIASGGDGRIVQMWVAPQ